MFLLTMLSWFTKRILFLAKKKILFLAKKKILFLANEVPEPPILTPPKKTAATFMANTDPPPPLGKTAATHVPRY